MVTNGKTTVPAGKAENNVSGRVAVGTLVTPRSLYRAERTALPHSAFASADTSLFSFQVLLNQASVDA